MGEQKIKICHMTSVHDSRDVRVFQKECVSLAAHPEFAVTLVAPGESREEKGVQVLGVGPRPINRIQRFLLFTKRVYKEALRVDADIYHFHDPELMGKAIKLKRHGKIVIFDSHEFTASQILLKNYIPRFLRKGVARFYRWREKKNCRKLDAVIFPCTIEGKHPFAEEAKRTEIIGNFPDLTFWKPEEGVQKEYDVCCTGSLTAERGITALLTAAKKKGLCVALAGAFSPANYADALKEQGLLEGVNYFGVCPPTQIRDIVRRSKYCFSGIQDKGQYAKLENFPTKVYEAMAVGLPVIMSRFVYPERINREAEFALLIDPADAHALEDAMEKMRDASFRERLGQNGRKLVEERFSWQQDEKRLYRLYCALSEGLGHAREN